MSALSIFLILCLLALMAWVSYFVISGLFVWPPPIPTRRRTRRRMIEAIRKLRPVGTTGSVIFDPGCGFGRSRAGAGAVISPGRSGRDRSAATAAPGSRS